MKKVSIFFKNKLVISLIVLACIGLGIMLTVKSSSLDKHLPNDTISNIQELDKNSIAQSLEVRELGKLYEIEKDQPVITAIMKDPTPLLEKYPFLKRAYKGDAIITTPKQTVIFDMSTKTIRDISDISLYDELSNK